MKIFKKMTAFMLILCIFTSIPITNAAESDIYPSDNVLLKLVALDVWEGDLSNQSVTRGDFAQIIAKMLGIDKSMLNSSDAGIFYDVTAKDSCFYAVQALYQMGIISGYDKSYHPNELITYSEAVKMLVTALGYDIYAEDMGGYPTGYFIAAQQNNIVPKSFSRGTGDYLTFIDAAVILDTAVDAFILSQKSYGNQQIYQTETKETVLSKYHSIYKTEGVLSAAGGIRINSEEWIHEDVAEINGQLFEIGNLHINQLVGYQISAYYKKTNRDTYGQLVYVQETSNLNEVLRLNHDEVRRYVLGKLYYSKEYANNGKEQSVLIPISIDALINDRYVKEFSKDDVEKADKIVLIDNDNDGEYDVMLLEKYEIVVVSTVDAREKIAYGMYKGAVNSVNLNQMGSWKVIMTDGNGNPIGFHDIGKWTILNVYPFPNKKGVRVIATENRISGFLETIYKNEDIFEVKLIVNGKEFKFSKNALNIDHANALKVGTEYQFYLDADGRVAAIDNTTLPYRYGYIVDAQMEDKISNNLLIQMYTTAGKLEILRVSEKSEVDGDRGLSNKKVFDLLCTHDGGKTPESTVFQRPVRYEQNREGLITKIDTNRKGASEQMDAGKICDAQTFTYYDMDIGSFSYNGITKTIRNQVRLDKDTVLFFIPKEAEFKNDVQKYGVKRIEDLTKYTTGDAVFAYDVSKGRTAKLIVTTVTNGGGTIVGNETPITVVDRFTRRLNEDGDIVDVLYGYQYGRLISVPFAKDFGPNKFYKNPLDASAPIESKLQFGDIIRFAVNGRGEINDYDKIFSLSDSDDPNIVKRGNEFYNTLEYSLYRTLLSIPRDEDSGNPLYNGRVFYARGKTWFYYGIQFQAVYGRVTNKSGTYIIVEGYTNNEDKDIIEVINAIDRPIITIDEAKQIIYPSSLDEIISEKDAGEEASRVIYHKRDGKYEGMVIVKRDPAKNIELIPEEE